MIIMLLESLGIDPQDPEVVEAAEDFNEFADLMSALVARRRALGKTQTEVAREMGTKQSAISAIESSSANPSIQRLQRYARALGVQLKLGTTTPSLQRSDWTVVKQSSTDDPAPSVRVTPFRPVTGKDWHLWKAQDVA